MLTVLFSLWKAIGETREVLLLVFFLSLHTTSVPFPLHGQTFSVYCISLYFIFFTLFFKKILFIERTSSGGGAEREGEQVDALLREEPNLGLIPGPPRS